MTGIRSDDAADAGVAEAMREAREVAALVPLPSRESWESFIQCLYIASKMQRSATANRSELPPPYSEIGIQKVAIEHALNSLSEMLHALPELRSRGMIDPFAQLLAAMTDVEEGKAPGLFRASRRTARLHIAEEATMALAAIALDCLRTAGEGREAAARRVARALAAGEMKVSRGKSDAGQWETVAGWRDRLSDGRAPKYAAQLWRSYKSSPGAYGPTPAARAERLLKMLRGTRMRSILSWR